MTIHQQKTKVNFGPKGKILSAKMTAPGYFGKDQTYELKVHRGFNGVFSDGLYDTLLEDITPLLQRESGQDNGGGLYYENIIHFFGHLLGGANAQLFGTYFAFFPEVKTLVTTLGAPRQGNYAYKILVECLCRTLLCGGWSTVEMLSHACRFFNIIMQDT